VVSVISGVVNLHLLFSAILPVFCISSLFLSCRDIHIIFVSSLLLFLLQNALTLRKELNSFSTSRTCPYEQKRVNPYSNLILIFSCFFCSCI